jgi:hypothetical protein
MKRRLLVRIIFYLLRGHVKKKKKKKKKNKIKTKAKQIQTKDYSLRLLRYVKRAIAKDKV